MRRRFIIYSRARIIPYLVAALVLLGNSSIASAQASRTWVSGVGDDANPCSRTAPCKTFAGALNKAADKGEINVIDPGAYGTVTITKSITILSDGNIAGVLASGTNGIVINSSSAIVTLRGLDIEGFGTGLSGIKVVDCAALYVEDCTINRFTNFGIEFVNATDKAKLFVKNTVIRNCGNSLGGGGILLKPSATGSTCSGSIYRTDLEKNTAGLRAEDGSTVNVVASSATGSTGVGFAALTVNPAPASPRKAVLNLENTLVGTNGLGVLAQGPNTTVRLSGVNVLSNTNNGVINSLSGTILSFQNNRIAGNGTDGLPTGTLNLQ